MHFLFSFKNYVFVLLLTLIFHLIKVISNMKKLKGGAGTREREGGGGVRRKRRREEGRNQENITKGE